MKAVFALFFCLIGNGLSQEKLPSGSLGKGSRPNIIIFFADDISARELPIYRSDEWTDPYRNTTQELKYRAKTPVLDKLAEEGCFIKDAWAATVCKPSRAMIMTGRYAHIQKWWNNQDAGKSFDEKGKLRDWPIYESSPILMSHLAQRSGYATYLVGKSHLAGDQTKLGFDEACFTPGDFDGLEPSLNRFRLETVKKEKKQVLINADTGETVEGYAQQSWYWYPFVRLLNHPSTSEEWTWWPHTTESQQSYGLNTYGPDVELDFAFEYMDRAKESQKPFFIYHASHLGHDAFDWLNPESDSKWPGTPKIHWDGEKYTRVDPKITREEGGYQTHGTITGSGIHNHINYMDYQVWLYMQKLREIGEEENTIFILTADNGTLGWGKNTSEQQRGCHVPMIIYAPGMTKKGEQKTLASLADIHPTVAELAGFTIPEDYEISGRSLVPFLFTDKKKHRDWIYSYRGPEQIIRTDRVLRDGRHRWWEVSQTPSDLTSYEEITEWSNLSEKHRSDAMRMKKIMSRFDLWDTAHDAPGVPPQPIIKGKGRAYFRGKK